MRYTLLLSALVLVFCQTSCTDQCTETRRFKQFTPVTVALAEIRQSIKTEPSRDLINPGKIYVKGNFLLINEIKEGLHVVDNSNPASPQMVSFIKIPGNGDMAVRGNILYADSYCDLVALDISNPRAIKEVGRVNEVFPNGQFDGVGWNLNSQTGSIRDSKTEIVTETLKTNCEGSNGSWWGRGIWLFAADGRAMMQSAAPNTNAGSQGQAGSMARFALYDRYLYTVTQNALQLFDIRTPEAPRRGNTINLGWGIETIFPYRDKLFIGSTTGMFIFDNVNPEAPKQLSVFQHAFACDPVVVHENRAYVTLRSGTMCNRGLNQLDVVDISDLRAPKLVKSYPMQNPHGLGIDFPNLYLCEGTHGLKSLDAQNDFDLRQLQHLTGIDAYDVIPLANRSLLMIGKDGFYQFDVSNPAKLKQISKIPVKRVVL
ncbi:MAG: LVIVD repeat-containing protein [Runella sp.]